MTRGRTAAVWASTLALLLVFLPVSGRAASDFGVTGLIDTPTADVMDDGALRLTWSSQDIVSIYSINYQPMPWLEASFRYSIFNPYRRPGSTDFRRDRSFEVKLRLLEETETRPALAFGVKDLVGTGVFGAEYLVASKEVGPLDFSLGLGWGRLAERGPIDNPLTLIDSAFEERDADISVEQSGRFRLSNYLSSEGLGVFGGVRYRLPRYDLALVAEYNSDSYPREVGRGTVSETDPWSFALEWEPAQDIEAAISWQQGNQVGVRLSATLDTLADTLPKPPNGYGAPGTSLRLHRRMSSRARWYDRLVHDAQTSGLLLRSATPLDERTLLVEYSNRDYQYEADAIGRTLTLLEIYAPESYRRFILTSRSAEAYTHSIVYEREGLEPWAAAADIDDALRRPRVVSPIIPEDPEFRTRYRFPNALLAPSVSVRPYLFDPDSPFRAQIFLRLNLDVDLGSGFGVTASYMQDLYNQFDGIERGSDSVLPKVRSDVVRYLQEGASGVDRLVLTHRGHLAPDIQYLAFAGILEEQYGGAGFEVLHRPFGGRVGVGLSAIWVRQRGFEKDFQFRDYQTVVGHVSAYWATPFYGFDAVIRAGRYLAKDWGATFEVNRRFANGWSIGAFATLTDVPFDEFGEGSFDKGLVFRIPFNPFRSRNTRGAYKTILRAVQRDGGQRIENWDATLWETLRHTHYDDLATRTARMMP